MPLPVNRYLLSNAKRSSYKRDLQWESIYKRIDEMTKKDESKNIKMVLKHNKDTPASKTVWEDDMELSHNSAPLKRFLHQMDGNLQNIRIA